MVDQFVNLSPVWQAFLATCFTWFVTARGAATVFFFKEVNRKLLDGMLGFAAGVMIAVTSHLLTIGYQVFVLRSKWSMMLYPQDLKDGLQALLYNIGFAKTAQKWDVIPSRRNLNIGHSCGATR